MLNLEGNICGEPYGSDTTSAPRELLEGLRNAGVDLIQMANSCTINNGLIGLTSTLQTIRAAGLEPVGAFASESEFQQSKGYTITEAQGVKVAFVAFTKGLGGRGLPAGNDNLVNILYEDYASTYDKIDRTRITSVLKAVEAEKPDITIALLHWGSEYNDDISDTQKSIVNLMKKQGVDVIIGTHPHVVQNAAWLTGANGNTTFIVYSLGNFINAQSSRDNVIGAILDVYFDKTTQPDGSVSIAIRDPKLHCVISQYEAGYKNIRVIPYSQYTDELGAAHGEFTLSCEYIESMLRSTIDEEFLTLD